MSFAIVGEVVASREGVAAGLEARLRAERERLTRELLPVHLRRPRRVERSATTRWTGSAGFAAGCAS